MTIFGLTPEGFNRKRLPDVKEDQEEALTAQYGEIDTDPQSLFGQEIGVFSKQYTDNWETMEDVYYSSYPNTAEGVSLDYVVALNGITRLSAQATRVTAICYGLQSTLIPQNALALQPTTNDSFYCELDTIISSENAVDTTISVDALASQRYENLVNGNLYFASYPRIIFDALFVTANVVTPSINSVELTGVPFNTDSQTTIEDVATAIQALTSVLSATAKLGLVINFDIDFDSNSSILATINGVGLTPVIWNVNQAGTIADLATEIQGDESVTTCTVTGVNQITIVPVDEGTFQVDSIITSGLAPQPVPIDQVIDVVPDLSQMVTVDYVTTTLGASQANATSVFRTPSTINTVVAQLATVINAGVVPVTITNNLDGTYRALANDGLTSYSISTNANFTIQTIGSPVQFLANELGPIPVPINTLIEILSPISGWNSITNLVAGQTGREIETDAELRLRRQNSVRIVGSATVEAIRARILQEVSGVTQAFVFENRTMKEVDVEIVFSIDLVASNQVAITVNSVPLTPVVYAVSHLNTMQLIAVALMTVSGIDVVTVGGAGNRTLTVVFDQGYDMYILPPSVSGGTVQANTTVSGGRVPKSFEVVVQGGTNEDIGNKIWETKPAGIQTFGNTSYGVIDSQGDTQVMNFSRPVPIYIWLNLDLTLTTEETFPTNGIELVKQAIQLYGDSLGIGEDVFNQRVLCQIFEVSGIAKGNLTMTSTLNIGDSPSNFNANDISISDSQLAIFNISRMNVLVI